MFGRDAECDAVVAHLERGERLVTVVGAGGIGKTRLAEEVAHRTRDVWPSGVSLVRLSSARDVPRSIARALGIPLPRSARAEKDTSLATLVEALCERSAMLIVLDDCDAVLEQVASFARACIDRATPVRLLVTTREHLDIAGERVVMVNPLTLDAAIRMFEARAAGDADDDVRALVERLDGIPLAIELAASRIRVMSPRELLSRLEERFRILKSDRRDLRERHLTLAGTLEWSWELSRPDERRAFACLGVFSGPFTLEAFEAVVGLEIESDPIDVASALLRKSLVTRIAGGGPARLSMLETLRAFARSKLSSLETRLPIERRHALFYVERAEEMAARTYGPNAEHALGELEADLPHVLAVFDRELTRTPDLVARVGVALSDLVLFRNAVDLRSPYFALARAAADEAGSGPLRIRARVLEARIALELGQPEAAEKQLTEALVLAADGPLEAEVLRGLGWARIALGRWGEAEASLERALSRHHAAGDGRGEADALAARGIARALQGELERAHVFLSAAHALHVASGDAIRRAKVAEMATLVGLSLEGDDLSTSPSIDVLLTSAEAHHAAGRLWRAALDLLRMAELASAAGDEEQAHSALARARLYAERANVPPTLCNLVARRTNAAFHPPTPGESANAAFHPPPPEGEGWGEGAYPQLEAPNAAAPSPWRIGAQARWMVTPDGTRTDLMRHGPVRRILHALATLHTTDKARALSAVELLESGWPGERVRYEAGMLRVYTAIRRLRKLGLEPILVTRDDGYLLDPGAHIVHAEAINAPASTAE